MTDLTKAAGTGAGVHWFVAWRYLLARPRRLSGPILSVAALCLWILGGFLLPVAAWYPLADELMSPFAVMPWWLLIATGLAVALVVVWLLVIGVRFVIYSPTSGPTQHLLRRAFWVLLLVSAPFALGLFGGRIGLLVLGFTWLAWGIAVALVSVYLPAGSTGPGRLRQILLVLLGVSAFFGAGVIARDAWWLRDSMLDALPIAWLAWIAAAAIAGALSRHPGDAAPSMLVVAAIGGLAALSLFGIIDYFHRPYGVPGPEPIGAGLLGLAGAILGFLLISFPLLLAALARRRRQGRVGFGHPAAAGRNLLAVILRFPTRYWVLSIFALDIALVALLLTGAGYGFVAVIWPARGLVPAGSILAIAALAAGGLAALGLGVAIAVRQRPLAATAIRASLLALVVGLLCAAAIGLLYVRGLAFSDLPSATRAGAIKLPLGVNIPMLVAAALLAPTILLAAIRYFFTFFSTVSIGGVAIGSMALVIVLSVMGGFENDLRRKILGSNAHMLVTKASDEPTICKVLPQLRWHRCVIDVDHAFTEYREISAAIDKAPGVIASSPYLISEVVIAANNNYANVIIKGVDPETVGDVSELEDNTETPDALARLWPLSEEGEVIGKPKAEPGPTPDGEDPGFDLPEDPQPVDLSGGADAGPAADAGVDFDLPADPQPLDLSGGPDAGEPDDIDIITEIDEMPPLDDFAPSIAQEGLHDAAREFTAAIPPRVAILPGVLVGRELVKQINLYEGQEVKVVSPLGQDTPLGPVPRTKPFRVGGVFFTGMYEYDLKFIYVELGALQDFLDLGDEVTGIEIRVADPENTGDVVAALSERLGPAYEVQDWKSINRSLFSALKLEKIAMFLVLAIIILVASFSIVGNLIMVVIEKAREIAVIKTLGASDAGVLKIFVTQGFFIGLVGTGVGVALGLAACWAGIQFGLPLDPDVYYIDKLPIHVEPTSVLLVAAAGIVISVVATLYPAYIAARLRPIHGLRYE